MNEEAASTSESVPQIFKNNIEPLLNSGVQFVTKIPKLEDAKWAMYKKRKTKQQIRKIVYDNVSEVEIPATFTSFLLDDYNQDGCRILVFFSKIDLLPNIKEFFIDATFKSTPKPFYQLLVVHGDLGSTVNTTKVVPLFFALMSHKDENSYLQLFNMLKNKAPNWMPKVVHIDFEMAISNALKHHFPNVAIRRCYFHFKQTIYRKYKNMNGSKMKIYKKIVSLCTVLPLLPLEMVTEGYIYIKCKSLMLENDTIDEFMEYIEDYFFRSEEFVQEWCIASERHRTNNVCEGWNSKLNKAINKNYNPILKFLTVLKQIADESVKIKRRNITQIKTDELIIWTQMELLQHEITVRSFLNELI